MAAFKPPLHPTKMEGLACPNMTIYRENFTKKKPEIDPRKALMMSTLKNG
jgi:hypothetical protein